ncbi:MAG: 2-dehydropantoate 2-reductase [Thermodesulfobacteriota bacterium]|nr:2-dehydropantoate 2-reductase [Thermodesulfobacteriota bacterium]
MKIGIIGPGALGCLFAAKLFPAVNEQDEILLIDHRPARADKLNDQGILYESDAGRHQIHIPVSSRPEKVGKCDILFSCVKSYDLEKSIEFTAPLLAPSTLFIFLQNGISHLQYDDKNMLQAIPAFATSSEGATLLAPGHIRHAGKGQTFLGFLSSKGEENNKRLHTITDILQNGGIDSAVSEDIQTRLWAKLFVNAGINGLTAIYNRTNGQLLTSCAARGKLKRLVREAEQVALALGIQLEEDPVAATLNVCKRTARNISSMLQDVRNHRPTEIDSINGAISRLGKKVTIATPLNNEIISQIKTIEKKYDEYQKS